MDTSALLAIVLDEPDAPRLLDAVLSAPRPRLSLASWFEAAMVIEAKGGRLASLRFDEFVRTAALELEPVTLEQAQAARMAWRYFGLHKHTARLNFGDCFAYALAKTCGEPLLFEGDAFGRTDIEPALASPEAGPTRQAAPQAPALAMSALDTPALDTPALDTPALEALPPGEAVTAPGPGRARAAGGS